MSSHLLFDNPKAMEWYAFEAMETLTDHFSIPKSYGINTLTLMNVSPQTLFCYWELTPAFFETTEASKDTLTLLLKTNNEVALQKIKLDTLIGSYYFEEVASSTPFFCEVLYYNQQGEPISLLTSNLIKTPSNRINTQEEESRIWMKKEEGWCEIIRSSIPSLSIQKSSKSLVDETTLFRKWEVNTLSSFENIKDKQ
ncbi:MAG: DUF4912 domain-containing protein [Sulfuricurvum sp.]|nr:DUF4912 domain-containing protein [Sulfuricurvum sp.]